MNEKGKKIYGVDYHNSHLPNNANDVVRSSLFSLEDNDMGLFFDIVIPCLILLVSLVMFVAFCYVHYQMLGWALLSLCVFSYIGLFFTAIYFLHNYIKIKRLL